MTAATVTHRKTATLPDQPGVEVNKAEWNDTHSITGLTDGQIIVGATGTEAAIQTVSGDATLAVSGALTLANTSVAANSYGSATQIPTFTVDAKGRLTAASTVTAPTGNSSAAACDSPLTVTGSLQDISGATLSLDAGTWIIVGVFDTTRNGVTNDRTFEGHLDSGGSDQTGTAEFSVPISGTIEATVVQVWRLVLGSTTTVKLRAKYSGGTSGDFTVSATNSTITAYQSGAASTEIVFSAAPNTDFDLTNGGVGGAVTIISKSVTGIVAGDQILMECFYTIFNNSAANRNITPAWDLGSLNINSGNAFYLIGPSATNRTSFVLRVLFSVSSTSLAYGLISQSGFSTPAAAGSFAAFNAAPSSQGWNTAAADLTGTQTIDWKMSSSATTATQTLTLHSYTIRKISTK